MNEHKAPPNCAAEPSDGYCHAQSDRAPCVFRKDRCTRAAHERTLFPCTFDDGSTIMFRPVPGDGIPDLP